MASPQNGFVSATSPVPAEGDVLLDSLTGDYKVGGVLGTGAVLTYSFPWSASESAVWATNPSYSPLDEPASGFALNTMQQTAFRSALATWSAVANVQFVEVPDTQSDVGDIRVAWTALPNPPSDAWTWQSEDFWANAGDIWLSDPLMGGQPDADWEAGGFNFMALIHELGHSLWLEHPFEGLDPMPAAFDNNQYTVMAYAEHPRYLFVRYHPAVTEPDGSVTVSWDVVPVYPCTPMLLDIAAIQRLYGANMAWHAGNDTYAFDPGTPFIMTIWDGGGVDTITVDNFDTDCLIDLRDGQFSSIPILPDPSITGLESPPLVPPLSADYDGTDNLAIAWGAVIENATGGRGDDTLIGNVSDNAMAGGAGNDTLNGGAGTDTAVFSGTLSDHLIRYNRGLGQASVTDQRADGDGVDTLSSIERLQFGSQVFDLLNPPRTAPPVFATSRSFLFDAAFYLLDNPELVPTVTLATAFDHYNSTGAAQGKAPTAWFEPDYYANRWPDLTPLNLDAATLFAHYNLYGVWEGRSAGRVFDLYDGNRYLTENPDVAAYVDAYVADFLGSRSNGAIAHYVIYGAAEGRIAYDFNGQPLDMAIVVGGNGG